jgi:hypothetical protein
MNAGLESPAHRQPGKAAPHWLLLLCLLLAGCGAPPKSTLDLPIEFTCDTRGRLEPCGCFKGQFGGLTRLKTVMDSENLPNTVRLDVGDAIGGHEDYDLIQYRYMLQAFAAMKYDALNLGHREAHLTAAQLRELKKASPVPLLSANLLDKATGQPIFDSWRLLQRRDRKIAVIGLLDPQGLEQELGDGLKVADMESTLARLLPEVRKQADLVILLAFADEAALSRLAQQFFEVQIILGGKVSQPAQDLKKENRSLIYFVTNEARTLAHLWVRLVNGRPPVDLNHEILFLHDRIPQDESFRKLAAAYRQEIRAARLAIDDPTNAASDMVPGVRTAATFVGPERCLHCHEAAGAVWTQTGHAKAFDTLIARNADADPKCIGCHTTGFGMPSGFRRNQAKAPLVNVSCEACHGPGSLHVRQREGDTSINFTYRPLDAGDCQKCHYGEFSRPFNWKEFWPPIRHGKEKKS